MRSAAPLLTQRRVLVDSSAYLGFLDADDEHHAQARRLFAELARLRYRLYTTNAMLFEAHALILSTLGRKTAGQFLQQVDASSTVVVRVRASDESRARQILFHYTDKDFSFNDAISFVVMERLTIRAAFTFDCDFVQYGLPILTTELLGASSP